MQDGEWLRWLVAGAVMLGIFLSAGNVNGEDLRSLKLPEVQRKPWKFDQFPILAWWGPPGTRSREDFQRYKDAGFTLYVANPDIGYDGAMQHARAVGLPCMVFRLWQGFALPRMDVDFNANQDIIVGWMVRDEPNEYEACRAAIEQMNALMCEDASRWALFNVLPPHMQLPSTEELIDSAVANGLPIISFDWYYTYKDGTDDVVLQTRNLERVRALSLKHGLPFWAFALTVSYDKHRRPSESDLRWQHYTNLAYGAKGLWYFTYWGPTDWENWDTQAIVNSADGATTPLYEHVKALNHAVLAMGPTLLKLTSTGVYHTNPPEGQKRFPAGQEWIADVHGKDVLLGFFKHEDGHDYAMVVNKLHGMNQSSADMSDELELTFADGVEQVTAVNWLDGQTGALKPDGRVARLKVAGGTGVLLRKD